MILQWKLGERLNKCAAHARAQPGRLAVGLLEAQAALSGKTAIVVGGAAGHLGRAITLGLSAAGVRIVCCDNDREGLAAIVPEVEGLGGSIIAIEGDVTDPASL